MQCNKLLKNSMNEPVSNGHKRAPNLYAKHAAAAGDLMDEINSGNKNEAMFILFWVIYYAPACFIF